MGKMISEKRGSRIVSYHHTHLRLKICVAIAIALLLTTYAASAFAVTVLPMEGVEFEQVDFLFEQATVLNSDWGRVSANPEELSHSTGLSSGYLNIYTNAGWVVQNLPVDLNISSYPVTTYFTLGLAAPENVSLLSAYVEFTSKPQHIFADGLRSDFPVGDAGCNAEGAGESHVTEVGAAPPANLVEFILDGPNTTMRYTQPNQNVQAAANQCFPMSIANSLQYLENNFGLNVPHNHILGLRGDNTLVGQLDLAANRWAPSRFFGSGVWFTPMLQGKFRYLANNGLANSLIHRHQGRGYGSPPNQALPNGNFTSSGITSIDNGAVVTWRWICDQIGKGEDVEIVWSYDWGNTPTGGHAVRVFDCGTTLGRPWIRFLHDRLQTNQDPTDSLGLEQVFTYTQDIDGDGTLNILGRNWEIRFALSESIKLRPELLDFGDAPDPTYPSRWISNGARHTGPKDFYFGKDVDYEADSRQVNIDLFDDGLISRFPITFRVTNPSGLVRYVNILIDWNQDGDWADPGEWALQNFSVPILTVTPGIYTPNQALSLPNNTWMRMTITNIQLINYVGSWPSVFDRGETEDYIFHGKKVNKHAYHFKVHQFNPLANNAVIWSSVWNWPWGLWGPWWPWGIWNAPVLQSAWSSCFSEWNAWTWTWPWGGWRVVNFWGRDIPYCTSCWFNVDFRSSIRPLTVSSAFFRWTLNNNFVGPWIWLGWKFTSPHTLYNPEMLPDDTLNTHTMTVRDIQFASSPARIPNEETTLDNPAVLDLFAASSDPVRPGSFTVLPGHELQITPEPDPNTIPDPEIEGRTVLAKGEILVPGVGEGGADEWMPFVLQFIAESWDLSAITPPVASFSWGSDTTTTLKVNFNASLSTCGSGDCTYDWDVTSNGTYDIAGITQSNTYGAAGYYDVTLRVTDNTYGLTATTKKTVQAKVINTPPNAAKTAPAVAGLLVTYTDTSSDAEDAQASLKVTTTWGDGVTTVNAGGTLQSHTYLRGGIYTIRHKVTDTGGLYKFSSNVTVTVR
ncbi:MAG: PKD domain-containing protein [Nitrospirae bacterium]|nr:PKD domain-containing protein [Nitrospirota bacterium]